MHFTLPEFEKAYLRLLTVCGEVQTEDKTLLESLAKRQELVAKCELPQGFSYFRILLGTEKGKHLHVDCASKEAFAKPPAPNCSLDEIQRILQLFEGLPADFGLKAAFFLPLSALPERGIIRSLCAEEKTGSISIRLTCGTFSIKGAPVHRIWWALSDETHVKVTLEATRAGTICAPYLKSSYDWVFDQLSLFVIGGSGDATKQT